MDRQYKVAKAEFEGQARDVVCSQNLCKSVSQTEPCNCAFMAICNYFLLYLPKVGRMFTSGSLDCQNLSEGELRNFISRYFLESTSNLIKRADTQEFVNFLTAERKQGLQLIKSLPAGLRPLDPAFYSPREFNLCGGRTFFALIGIPIVHGWIVNPEDAATHDAVGRNTRSELVTKISNLASAEGDAAAQRVLMKSFLDTTPTQFTEYGLSCLRNEVPDGKLAVLYRNGHYQVIYNYDKMLLTLETDQDVLASLPQTMWKTLETLDGDGFYLTSRFTLTPTQPNYLGAKRWYEGRITKLAAELEGSRDDETTGRKGQKNKTGNSSYESAMEGKEEFHVPDPPNQTKQEDPDADSESAASSLGRKYDLDAIGDDFLDFLFNFKTGSSTVPYFEGLVKLMVHLRITDMQLPYAFIKQHNKRMAIAIQDHHSRVHKALRTAVASYLVAQGLDRTLELDRMAVLEGANLEILDLPEPKCTECFEDFAAENKMLEEYKFFGMTVESTTYVGRKMASRILDYILDKFEAGKCWGGDWDESVMEMRNHGKEFIIDKEAEYDLTKELAFLDLNRFIEKVLKKCFKGVNGYPPYFDEFQIDAMGLPDPRSEPVKWKNFLKLMRNHFALKAPLVRSTFIFQIYRVTDSLRLGMGPTAPAFAQFDVRTDLLDWRFNAREFNPLRTVYMYKNWTTADKWQHSYWFLLQFARHSIEHVLNYTKGANLIQRIRDITIVDLILAERLGKFIAQFMRFFVNNCSTDSEFSSAWRQFEASECYDKIDINIMEGSEAGEDDVSTVEEILGNLLYEELSGEEKTAWVFAEVGLADENPLPSPSRKSLVLCDRSLADIEEALKTAGVQVEDRRALSPLLCKLLPPLSRLLRRGRHSSFAGAWETSSKVPRIP